jgi:hypothetical protein
MKRNLWTAALIATVTTLGYASVSLAGEGGIAGAAAFKLDANTGNFTEFAAASAIGKTTALAGSSISGTTGGLEAVALGTGGTASYSSSNTEAYNSYSYYYYGYSYPATESRSLSAGTDYDLGQAQANAIDATSIPSVPLP